MPRVAQYVREWTFCAVIKTDTEDCISVINMLLMNRPLFPSTLALQFPGLERIIYEKRCMGFELISEQLFMSNQAQGRSLEVWVPMGDPQRTQEGDEGMRRLRAEYKAAHQVGQYSVLHQAYVVGVGCIK